MLFLNKSQKKKAVCYYRHSAEDKQENSVPIQREHAERFAAQNDIEIIHEEADEGFTGLIAKRPAFTRLFKDWVENPNAPYFDYVFFTDASRWGRFLDTDEAAYYAFVCKKQGKIPVNVSRGFIKPGQEMMSGVIDSFDRFMAAEYSRVLSSKVWFGSMKISREGYSVGGVACYGMGRLLLDEQRKPIMLLKPGQHKLVANQRVVFTPLNDETTQTVKDIFDLFVNQWKTPNQIANILNDKKIPSANGGLWKPNKIIRILTNEVYTGTRVYNKTWGKLKQPKRDNPRSEWVVTPNAFDPVVSSEIFEQAQERLYWLTPSKWKRGIYMINRMRLSALKEIEQLLIQQGLDEAEVEASLPKIPIAFCISFHHNSVPHWCFIIDETMRQYEQVLGISVVLDRRDPVDQFFMLPTKDFNSSNFMIYSEKDPSFRDYKVDPDLVQQTILNLQQLVMPKKVTA